MPVAPIHLDISARSEEHVLMNDDIERGDDKSIRKARFLRRSCTALAFGFVEVLFKELTLSRSLYVGKTLLQM
jgi:hypothetical protein